MAELELSGPISLLSLRYAAYAQACYELLRAERILEQTIERSLKSDNQDAAGLAGGSLV